MASDRDATLEEVGGMAESGDRGGVLWRPCRRRDAEHRRSFYDFEAMAKRRVLASPPDDWGGRAAQAWGAALGSGARYDPTVEDLLGVARTLDRIYAAAAR